MTSITLDPPNSFMVRVDFSPPDATGDSSLSYQRIASDGQPIGAAVLLGPPADTADAAYQVDSFDAASLSDNGFVVAFEERMVGFSGNPIETLKAVVVAPDGSETLFTLPAGSGFPIIATFTNPRIEALSGDGFGVFYERQDGDQDSAHFALARPSTHDSVDVALPVPPQSITTVGGNLVVDFADGNQLLAGGEVASTLIGGAGDDTLIGGDNGNLIRGGAGNDSIQGGAGFDNINGNQGDDVIDGGSGGGDWLVGGQGADLINAHTGDGVLFGNFGNDTLNGGAGNEVLRGGQDNDVLNGGAGNDWLSGDRGDDTLTGGAGADIFHSFSGAGVDVVTDFNAAEGDRVQLDPGTSFTVIQSGDDVLIHLAFPNDAMPDVFSTVVLQNVQLASLPPDFIFLA